MNRRTAVGVLAAFMLAGAAGLFLGNRNAAASTPTTSTPPVVLSTAPPVATFVQAGETVVGPVAVVATDIRLDGEQVVLDFQLQNLAPLRDAATVTQVEGFGVREVLPEDLETVYTDQWTLVTTSGDIPGTAANPSARAARFDVGPDFALNSIEEVRLASYALRTPIDADFALDLDNDNAHVAPGLTARLLAVTEQTVTILQVEVLSERNFNTDNIRISGRGPGWKSAVREAEGRPRWNLTYESGQAPSPIELRLSGSIWLPIEADIPVAVEVTP
jgi:hypothetical protein